jgi:phosphatidylglycerol:prolipoprotein diacylglycerol transferase
MSIISIVWDVNPWLVKFSDSFGIRWYGVLFACAFLFGYIIFNRFFKKEGLSTEKLDQLTLYIALGTVIGARLGHCFFYDAAYYLKNPLEILQIWRGGLASHGASIGILVALYLYVRKNKMSFLWLIDRISVVTALGGFFIRMGNLMNSEIYGYPTSLPWGFKFMRDNKTFTDPHTGEILGKHLPCHPTQLYEALSYLVLFFILFYVIRKYGEKLKDGVIFGWFLIALFTSHMNMGQALSIPFILLGIGLLLWLRKHGKILQ